MKLSEYFQQQYTQQLSSKMKSDIFFRIQKEKLVWSTLPNTLNTRKFFVASKHLIYSSLATFIALVVFWWIILDKKDIIDLWFFSIQHLNSNQVRAGYVAEIIEFNWDYSITRGDKTLWLDLLVKNLIEDGDVIKLDDWAELLFTLTDWTQAKIAGPAEFSIIKSEKWYQISLIDWKFFRIYCPECVSDIDIITEETSIHQDKNQALDVQIAKEDDKILVKNSGDDVVVTTIKNQKKSELNTEKLISISSDWDAVNIISDSDLMLSFMNKNNISGTFTLSNEEVSWPTVNKTHSEKVLAMNNSDLVNENRNPENLDSNIEPALIEKEKDPILVWIMEVISAEEKGDIVVDEDISLELWLTSNEKQVPSETQMQNLKYNMNSFFLMNIFESIYKNQNADQWVAQLAERLNDLAKAFGYTSRADSDLNSVKWTALTLQSELEKDWYVSPAYLLQLEKIANWCDKLSYLLNWDNLESWEDFSVNLPINLRLM